MPRIKTGIGIRQIFQQGALLKLPQWLKDKFLFLGDYSAISGGKMPNKVGSDWLTVSGSAGLETFQCPNTAPYIAADTDFIWFNTSATNRTVTTAELIGYDLQRTPVKYDDTTPYQIRMIAIIKSGETFTQPQLNDLFKWFQLSIFWNNSLNANGHVKGNRIGQSIFPIDAPAILSDGNTVGWYSYKDLSGTSISSWPDKSGNNNHLLQTGADSLKPVLDSDGVLFDGLNDSLFGVLGITQPAEMIYFVGKVITWSSLDVIFDVYQNPHGQGTFELRDTAPQTCFYTNAQHLVSTQFGLNTWSILRLCLNGWDGFSIINNNIKETAIYGGSNMTGFRLGSRYLGDDRFSNIKVKGIIIRKIKDTDGNHQLIYNYLKSINGL